MTANCAAPVDTAGDGVAAALRAVDCMSQHATEASFSRLFGAQAAMLPVLTVLLTLAIGGFAVALLTGRTRLAVPSLGPRFITIALVITFATSWAAYSEVAWNLAARAPDAVAGVLTGDRGSAADAFAARVDGLMAALNQASDAATEAANTAAAARAAAANAGQPASASPATTAASPAGASPATIVWGGAAVLLLSTVGVLVAGRIVLALLLALGPVFVVMALFSATRGLFAGWLRALVLAALTPLLVVLGGGFTMVLARPVVARLAGPDGFDARTAMAFFVIACVHASLMALALRMAGVMVAGWRVFGHNEPEQPRSSGGSSVERPAAASLSRPELPARGRGRTITSLAAGPAVVVSGAALPPRVLAAPARPGASFSGMTHRSRATGLGSRFRAPPRGMRIR